MADAIATLNTSDALGRAAKFYQDFCGLTADFSSIPIPERQAGFDRLLIVAPGLTPNKVYEACAQRFPCWRYSNDLDAVLDWDKEERNPKDAPYAIWAGDTQAADPELQNLSANKVKEKGLTTETLTERLVHEAVYYHETRKHLDINTITLCAGSRYGGGRVPGVFWYGDCLYVSWCRSVSAFDHLRSRQVVS